MRLSVPVLALALLTPVAAAAKAPIAKTTQSAAAAPDPSSVAPEAPLKAVDEGSSETTHETSGETDQERARIEAEQAAAAEITVRIESNYDELLLKPVDGVSRSVFCARAPCTAKMKVDVAYLATAPGMQSGAAVVIDRTTRSVKIKGTSHARRVAGTTLGLVGVAAAFSGIVMVASSTDEAKEITNQGLFTAAAVTAGVGITLMIVAFPFWIGQSSLKTEAQSPAARSQAASKPRLLPTGTLVF